MEFVRKTDKRERGWTTRARAAPEPHARPRRRPRPRARTAGVVLGLALTGVVSSACAEPAEEGWPPAPGVRNDRPSAPAPDADGTSLAGTALALAESAERIRRQAADPRQGPGDQKGPGDPKGPEGREDPADRERRRAAAEKWGLDAPPLLAPPPPETKPELHTPPGFRRGSDMTGLPHVIARVPTDDRVVFLTIDDGDHKDPRLLRMLDELGVPVSAFLSHYLIRDGYDYFRTLRSQGSRVQNHTLDHPYLTSLSYAGQRDQICGQQRNLEREIGERPRLLRPPYGAYDRDTLRAAAACGIDVVPLWAAEAFPGRMEFRDGKRLRAGDIVLTHFRGPEEWDGTMPDVVRRVLRTATEQGFAVALLEDYI